jgi:H+-transporting ATPase
MEMEYVDLEELSHDGEGSRDPRTGEKGLTSAEAAKLLAQYGPNALPEKTKPKWLIYVEQLWQPMPIMIWIAAFTEAGIQNFADMAILLGIQFTNATLGYYEITKAGDAVAALKNSLKPLATVKRDGSWKNIDAIDLVPGDLVLLAAGSAIPADCIVKEGVLEVDQSALTGESMAVTMYAGSSCKMGSTVQRGEVEAFVEHTGANTFFGKTASMLNSGSDELGNLQKLLLQIVIVLVIISLTLSFIVFGYLLGAGNDVRHTVSFTVVLIVASIPIAIEIVCTTTLALGSKELSKHGAIVTRLAAIEDMAGMSVLCSDKTGTLTMNKMMIQAETPIYSEGDTQYTLLRYAAMAAKWQEPARDALDTMVLGQADLDSLASVRQVDYMPFDPVVKRTEGTIFNPSTQLCFKVTKGAPHILLKLSSDDESIKKKCEADVTRFGQRGIRCLAVARTDPYDPNNPPDASAQPGFHMLGLLTFLDPPRHDTKETIHRALSYGVQVKMITGDHLLIAMETARMLDLGDVVPAEDDDSGSGGERRTVVRPLIRGAEGLPMLDPITKKAPANLAADYGDYVFTGHGFAQVFPEHKFLIVQTLRELGFKTGMTGDGVNDAPALKRADVGIAVAGATDAARAASDIVLTEEGLSTIIDGLIISRCIFQRMKNFITYRIAATLQLLIFFFIAVLSMKPSDFMPSNYHEIAGFGEEGWPSYFKLPVLMLMLITLLNDGTLISVGYDRVQPSKFPNVWNVPVLFLVSSVLAGVALFSSLILLFLCLDSWTPGNLMSQWGVGELTYGQITTVIYLKVSISDFLTLFSARTHDGYFWSSAPSPILVGAATLSLFLSTMLACFWPKSKVDEQEVDGLANASAPVTLALFVWIYCIVWWFIQDVTKVWLYYWMESFNIFGINDSVMARMGGASSASSKGKDGVICKHLEKNSSAMDLTIGTNASHDGAPCDQL